MGLEDAYDKGRLMGTFAEDCAEKYQFTREAQDEFALRSLDNANKAQEAGKFSNEITPVTIKTRKGEIVVSTDESPRKAMPEKIPNLRPAFKKDGTVTAANASSISDGAAALILMRESDAKAQGLKIRARILGHASHAQEPNWFYHRACSGNQQFVEAYWLGQGRCRFMGDKRSICRSANGGAK